MLSETEIEAAWKEACDAREKAHAPYSKFHVGAVVKAKGHDQWFGGCNIENASYGGTVCAERVAIWNMVSTLGRQPLEAIVLVTDTDPVATPCGFCLQVMSEFGKADLPVLVGNLKGIQRRWVLSDMLGQPFDADNLN